ncbi:MAG: family 10 glycosylhydrolase [Muribaculaceae bacterium]|nr:family 10 glycosylhydrolase [Muribaculaceae bacterium]
MRKTITKALMATLTLVLSVNALYGATPAVKQEFRSTWLATVWQLDWPTTKVSSTGNQTQINNQKQELIVLLDSLKTNNFNAINLQVRSRSDALYKSSYEPWSSDLVSNRGLDPGWDPLEFAVEECHKRGMECHAWVNPYRYESVVGSWKGADDYRQTHPEWLLDIKGASILNPGLPEVTEQICKIVKEIVQNYDIDGMLFDDYFYLSGVSEADDGDLFQAYKDNGGTLTNIKDWRRANVNNMIKQVYNTIQETKPWVRFGVGPAGIACTSYDVAKNYGITPCPTGSDWQYNDIYSDPIAWLAEGTVDFMTPQIYWTVENSSPNYEVATKWWSQVAAKFNRHMFVSQDISSITNVSEITPFAASSIETVIMGSNEASPMAGGPHNANLYEYSKEVKVNREYTLDDAPGSVFYSAKYLYKKGFGKGLLGHHLRNEVFTTPALVPAMTHKKSNNPGLVSDIERVGNRLSWKGYDNVRYTVYAVPESEESFTRQPEYLLGVTYTPSYEIPAEKVANHRYAVCVYDRLGFEYSAAFMGEKVFDLEGPELIAPAEGAEVEAPFDFSWNEVKDALVYTVDVASDAEFNHMLASVSTESCILSSSTMQALPMGEKIYWRVRVSGNNANDGISAVRTAVPNRARLTYPTDMQAKTELAPCFKWTPEERKINLEISNSEDFANLVYTAEAEGGSHQMTSYLAAGSKYFARFHYNHQGENLTSPVISFFTQYADPMVPEVISPVNGGSFYGNETIKHKPVIGASQIVYYIAKTASGLARGSSYKGEFNSNESCPIKEIPSSKTFLKEGDTYFFKVVATFITETGTERRETPAFSAVYLGDDSGVEGIASDSENIVIKDNTVILGGKPATVEVFGVDGRLIMSLTSNGEDVTLGNLDAGLYLIKVTGDSTKTIKHRIL